MGRSRKTPTLSAWMFFTTMFLMASYFAFASVQGESGLFRRIQIEAEAAALEAERRALEAEIAELRNKTKRLSDEYLDLDLLDQQARGVLGYIRADEVIIR